LGAIVNPSLPPAISLRSGGVNPEHLPGSEKGFGAEVCPLGSGGLERERASGQFSHPKPQILR